MPQQKQCGSSGCGEWYETKVFFRLDASSPDGRHSICIGCEQTNRDEEKSIDRWPTKIRDITRRHAPKFDLTPEQLRDDYGWEFDRMLHEAQHVYSNGCQYCGVAFSTMGHGLADLTLDIFDPNERPFYPANTRWACATCNRAKSRMTPADWAARLAAWAKWRRRRKMLEFEQYTLF